MNPTLLAAGVGLIGSLFGGSSKTPAYVKQNADLQNSILRAAMNNYNNADLAHQDAQTVSDYSSAVMNHAQTMLGNYDAKAAGAGGEGGRVDTQNDRARAQIAGDASTQIAQLQANLDQTRTARQAALLPNASQAAAGTQAAMYLDQQQYGENARRLQGIGAAAGLVNGLWPRGSSGTSGAAGDFQAGYGDPGGYDDDEDEASRYAKQLVGAFAGTGF